MKAAMKAMKVGGMKVGPKLKKKAVLVGRDGARRLNDAWGTVIKEPFKAKGNARLGTKVQAAKLGYFWMKSVFNCLNKMDAKFLVNYN